MKKLFFALASSIALQTNAVNVGDITSIINANEKTLAKEVTNTTNTARYIALKIDKITNPTADGKVIPLENNEILSTPSGLVLPGGGQDVFKILYNGPEDDQERYYRLSWLDAPVLGNEENTANKGALATTSAIINTILVVTPRKDKFDYQYSNGTIKNTGNASFRIVAAGSCLDPKKDIDGKGCRERYYVMPGKSITLKFTDWNSSKTHLGVWYQGQYINVNKNK
jgi:Mat/Ecp fimbriae periplasmic chaperone